MREALLELRQRADVVTRAHCCTECCVLNGLGYPGGKQLVFECMSSRATMTRKENKADLHSIVKVRYSVVP